jgi:uncharacterized membrane protein YeaQ/YmgE (transglycosylase-associated protein family)
MQRHEFFGIGISNTVIYWGIVGLIAGWLTGKLTRGRGFGCIADVLIGLVGAFIGGWLFTKLGINFYGIIGSIAAATVGAVLLVSVARLLAGRD